MVIARRLLIAGGGSGAFAPPAPLSDTITTAPAGGAVVVNTPWAVYQSAYQKTAIAYVRGDNGNVEVVEFDNVTRTTSSPFVLHAAYEVDDHAAPAICRLASGHLVAAYSKHLAAPINVRVQTTPGDITTWDAEQSLSHGASTYCNLFELTAEGKLYCFFRWRPDDTSHLMYITSTDGGNTWGADTAVYAVTNQGTYWHLASNGVDRIDIVVTDIVPSITGGGLPASLGHFYMTGGSFYKSDGTAMGSPPFTFTDTTKIINGPTVGGGCFPFDISPIGPTVAVNVYLAGGTDDAYYDARYTGGVWQTGFVANAGGTFDVGQATGMSHDRDDPDSCVVGQYVGGNWQMVQFTTSDNGVTWASAGQLTANSTADVYAWVQAVVDGPSDLRHVVNYGTITDDTHFSLGNVGLRR
jgi:hypothetical protein